MAGAGTVVVVVVVLVAFRFCILLSALVMYCVGCCVLFIAWTVAAHAANCATDRAVASWSVVGCVGGSGVSCCIVEECAVCWVMAWVWASCLGGGGSVVAVVVIRCAGRMCACSMRWRAAFTSA